MNKNINKKINPRDPRTEGEEKLLDVLSNSERFKEWVIFEQPHINSMKPDFILLHPKRGIIIIEVKDWNLKLNTYGSDAFIVGDDGELHKKDPIQQVENYKSLLLKSDLYNTESLVESDDRYYGCIETVVYFHGVSKDEAKRFCGNSMNTYTKIWTDDDIEFINNVNNKLNSSTYTYALSRDESIFYKKGVLEPLVQELICNLNYSDYNYERRKPFTLTKDQNNLAELKNDSIRRWSGVAGAGKSLILAEKAVRALKSGNRVLILTYNITLRHYLRDLCSQQFGVGDYEGERKKLREDLTIVHFHQLLKTIMTEHEITTNDRENSKAVETLQTLDDIIDNENTEKSDEFTKRWINTINLYGEHNKFKEQFNYDYILIDEGQDFEGDWIRFVKQLFTRKGEMLIVYDKAQDLYNHGVWIEDAKQIKDIGFRGQAGRLKYTERLPRGIVEKIELVRRELSINEEAIEVPEYKQDSFLNRITWENCNADRLDEKIEKICEYVKLLKSSNSFEDITILTTNENTGVKVVEFFKSKGIKVSHVYDMQAEKDADRRRNEKWKFIGGTGRLKVCSYHSYKGWQTPNVILILDSPCTSYRDGEILVSNEETHSVEDSIFISMSRVKEKSDTGEYSFTCLNYIEKFNELEKVFK